MTRIAEQQQEREAALAAYARHAWREAVDLFARADAAKTLTAADLELYSAATWWTGDPDGAVAVRERAYAAYADAKDTRGAARSAVELAQGNFMRGTETIGMAWLTRAERLLAEQPESREHAHLLFLQAIIAGETGDPAAAATRAREAYDVALRQGDRDLQALSLSLQGIALIGTGDVREGMRLVDEATVAAVSGELDLFYTGWVYCMTISACRDLGDMRRAGEWSEAAQRWCERQSVTGFPGICKIRQAEITALRGALARAEQEARAACDELKRWRMRPALSEGLYEIGAIRLRMGDLPAAEEALRQVHELGGNAEPAMSLIRLAEGKPAAAHAALQRALAGARGKPARARMLPAQVEVAVAAGDLASARAAAAELDEIAAAFGTPALGASAHASRGALLLAEGDAKSAADELRRALEGWQKLDAPYEASQARMALAQAFRALGDDDSARLELRSAKATFERIGAARDARAAALALGDDGAAGAGAGERVTRTFLFTDIVRSTDLLSVIGDEAWQDLLRWHDDALRALIAEHGGEEIRHQGDGLVVSFARAEHALAAAVAIQRRLAEHRRAQGFAPAVRIGVHEAAATKRGLDYSGVGVHEAARIGALAGGGEIIVTRATLAASAVPFATGDPRTVELKGIAAPVDVLPVIWR